MAWGRNKQDKQPGPRTNSGGWHSGDASDSSRTGDHSPRRGEDTAPYRRSNFGRNDGS
ncbi:hypothetical protein [Streptomyces sp. NPDC058247]|uniref:hypothetical protein n=1 Tax=Streptomyces sp. NPDC058247 TaxID=3346401 RepID=UPI0036EC5840